MFLSLIVLCYVKVNHMITRLSACATLVALVVLSGCGPTPSAVTSSAVTPSTPSVATTLTTPTTPLPVISPALASVPAAVALPAGGVSLLPADPFSTFGVQRELADSGKVEVIPDSAAPSGKVIRITLSQKPALWWHAQIRWKTIVPIEKGRALSVRMLVRAPVGAPETGEGQIEIAAQRAGPPWNTVGAPALTASVGLDWKWVYFVAAADDQFAADGVQVSLNCGYMPQVIEIGAVEAFVFPASVSVGALPFPKVTYEGREPDAAWRELAAQRIEKFRKGDLSVVVVDAAGTPVKDARVEVRMKRHAFLFGTCINANLLKDGPDGDRYRDVVAKLFNVVVHENAMKWTDMVWVGNFSPGARKRTPEEQAQRIVNINRSLDWTESHGIKTRGHTLIWPGFGTRHAFLPPYLKAMVDAGDKAGVTAEIDQRFQSIITLSKGRILEWDVVNESVMNTALQDFLGRQEMVRWYKLAKQIDPNTVNVINDYMMLSGGAIPSRVDSYYDEIKWLLENGAPIDAIGEQAHFGWNLPGMERTWGILERFAAFGKPLRITEFDVAINDETLQADYTRDFYTLVFSHPKMEQILMWGFWEDSHSSPSAAMFRKDWTPKPNYHAFHDLVFKQWWTNADGTTNPAGRFETRGFFGDYTVTVSDGTKGETKSTVAQTRLDRAGTTLTITLK